MKKVLIVLFTVVLFLSCTRETIVENPYPKTEVFEVTVNFTPNPNSYFERLIPLNPPIFAADVVLVYIRWEVDNGQNVWRLMPQLVQYSIDGDFIYNYDYTRFDVNLFLESEDIDLTTLGPEWVSNQRFRIVILPGFFAQANQLNYNDYDQVMNALNSNFDVVFKNL